MATDQTIGSRAYWRTLAEADEAVRLQAAQDALAAHGLGVDRNRRDRGRADLPLDVWEALAAVVNGHEASRPEPVRCIYYEQPGHTPDQKPHPSVYGSDPDLWPLCPSCAAYIQAAVAGLEKT